MVRKKRKGKATVMKEMSLRRRYLMRRIHLRRRKRRYLKEKISELE